MTAEPIPLYDCTECFDMGTLGISPEGERIYCHDCIDGVRLHIAVTSERMENAAIWLRDMEWQEWAPDCFEIAEAYLKSETALFDELSAKLDTLRYDETNRPIAHLFEDDL